MEDNIVVIVAVMIPESEWIYASEGEDRPPNDGLKQLLIQGVDLDTYEVLEWYDE